MNFPIGGHFLYSIALGLISPSKIFPSSGFFSKSSLYAETGLLYQYTKSNYNITSDGKTTEYSIGLSYLDIPIGVRYVLQIKNKISVFTRMGFYLGIPLGASLESSSGNSRDLDNNFRFGFQFGPGGEYEIDKKLSVGGGTLIKYNFNMLYEETNLEIDNWAWNFYLHCSYKL